MISYNIEMLNKYLKNDWILKLIDENTNQTEADIRTNKWLVEMDNKRMIYADVYGDILEMNNKEKTVLDIGGGCDGTYQNFRKKFRLYVM